MHFKNLPTSECVVYGNSISKKKYDEVIGYWILVCEPEYERQQLKKIL